MMSITVKPKAPDAAAAKSPYTDHLTVGPNDLKSNTMKHTTEIEKKSAGDVVSHEVSHGEMPGPLVPLQDLCHITVQGSMTKNLGNYENAKIGVSLTVPCSKGDLDEAYEYASTWVSDKIEKAIESMG